jgi:hypothetical protein
LPRTLRLAGKRDGKFALLLGRLASNPLRAAAYVAVLIRAVAVLFSVHRCNKIQKEVVVWFSLNLHAAGCGTVFE